MASDGGGPSRRRPWPANRGRANARPGAPERPGAADRAQRAGRAQRGRDQRADRAQRAGQTAKPGATRLGVDLATLDWQRSGIGEGSLEVAFVWGPGGAPGQTARCARENVVQWVLLRVAGDASGRVLVYDRVEWLNFVDGAVRGEFDRASDLAAFRRPDEAGNTLMRHSRRFDPAIVGQIVSAVR